jgi:diaminopimelate epimerase
MKKIKFFKYHALGNDFLIIDRIGNAYRSLDFTELAKGICSRRFGVGADGILVLSRSRRLDCRMDIFNRDGSWAEKSANGLRIMAAYYRSTYSSKKVIQIETESDDAETKIISGGKDKSLIRVCLGKPRFGTKDVPIKTRSRYHINLPTRIGQHEYTLTAVSVGNPHAVIFVDNFNFDWELLGSAIENSSRFPNRTNVEFAKIRTRSKIILNEWERGAGATGSCGTGAAAAVAAGVVCGFLNRTVEVEFANGSMKLEWKAKNDLLYLTGPVEYVGRGEYLLK